MSAHWLRFVEYDQHALISLVFFILNNNRYAASSNQVYGYDLRYHAFPSSTTAQAYSSETHTEPSPILRSPHFDVSNYFDCPDEINQLSFRFQSMVVKSISYLLPVIVEMCTFVKMCRIYTRNNINQMMCRDH